MRSEALYGSWFSHDHQSLVWDNNLNLAVCRAIYDSTFARVNGNSINDVLKFHFDKKFSSINKYHLAEEEKTKFIVKKYKKITVNTETINESGKIGMGEIGQYIINLEELNSNFTRMIVVSKFGVRKTEFLVF